jgi:hypothetical protein
MLSGFGRECGLPLSGANCGPLAAFPAICLLAGGESYTIMFALACHSISFKATPMSSRKLFTRWIGRLQPGAAQAARLFSEPYVHHGTPSGNKFHFLRDQCSQEVRQ